MKRHLCTIIILLFITGVTEGQVLPVTHYTTRSEINPLPSADVNQVFQDSSGYIWFAVFSSGLVRYDGVSMQTYDTKDGLRDLAVWDLVEGSSGRLWVSSNAGLVVSQKPLSSYQYGERIKFISEQSGVRLLDTSVKTNRMTVGRNHWLWVGTENVGIVRYKFLSNGKLISDTLSTRYPGVQNGTSVRAIVARKDSSVWVSLLNGKLLKYKNKKIVGVYNPGGKKSTTALYESPDGNLWGGQQDGRVWRLEKVNGHNRFYEVSHNKLNSYISGITSDSDGIIWVSSQGSGIQKINPKNDKIIASYTRSNGLLSDIIYNVVEDREKNIWIAQSGGVSKLRYNYKAFKNLTSLSYSGEQPVLPSAAVNSVLPSPGSGPCLLWAGTSEGGVACINHDFKSSYIQKENGLASNWVNGLSYDRSGRLWIGSKSGINSITFDGTKPVKGFTNHHRISISGRRATLWDYPLPSIYAINKLNMPVDSTDRKYINSIWFPAYHAVYVMANDKFYRLDESYGLPTTIFSAAAFDNNGYLWIATTDNGIYRSTRPVNLETLQLYTTGKEKDKSLFEPWWSIDNGASSNEVDNLLWYDGKMWVGTPKGLYAIDAKTKGILYKITTSDGLKSNAAISFAASPVTGELWVGTNSGLAEIDPEDGKVLRTVTQYDGLVDNEVWFFGSVKVDKKGTVYFGTAKGISIYDPSKDKPNRLPPIVQITNVISKQAPGKRNEFSFEYAALSFGNEHQIRYETRLSGYDDQWSKQKTDVRTEFTNLPALFFPKTYTFQVKAVNESGVWSTDERAYRFSVMPVWWLRWWAFIGYFVVFSAGVFSVDRIQRKRLLKKEREATLMRENQLKMEAAEARAKVLKAENDLKAAELEKAQDLQKAYDELKATQNRLIQAEKMASLGRLSTGIAHELKNPLNFINNFAEITKELVDELQAAMDDNDSEEVGFLMKNLSSNTRKIEEHGKRADSIVNAMMKNSSGSKAHFEYVNINDIIRTYSDLAFNVMINQKDGFDVSMPVELDANVPQLKLVAPKIGQALQNIIENALDAVWDLKLHRNGTFKPEVKISSVYKDHEIEICIADNGPGIPETIREKIFEPFFTTKPTGQGTGLGLSFSYDIITQIHGGSLKSENNPAGGTSFLISLPVSDVKQ